MKKHLLLIALAFMSLTATAATPSVLRQNIMRMMEQTGLKGNAESQAELMEQILPALAQRLSTPAPPPSPFDSAAISQYTIFVQQVLPLYNYQMKNCITPQPITSALYKSPKIPAGGFKAANATE